MKDTKTDTKDINPQEDGIPGLVELASRLQLPHVEEPENHNDLLMLAKDGKFYSLTTLLAYMTEFMSQVVVHVSTMMYQFINDTKSEEPEDAKDQK